MKFFVYGSILILLLVTHTVIGYQNEEGEDPSMLNNPTWARTFPPKVRKTVQPRPEPPKRTSTPLMRVSDSVTIWVPVSLFIATFAIGFSFIGYRQYKANHSRVTNSAHRRLSNA